MRTAAAFAGALGACLLATTATVAAQGGLRLDGSLPTGSTPALLQHVTIEQHLDKQIPLDLRFRDEAGRDVTLADYFRKGRPVVLAPVYYECPMLCTQVLNGLVTALRVVTLNPGSDFDILAVSFDPKEPAGLARDKKAAYLDRYSRPGTEAGWHFLTGPQESITPLMDAIGFKYAYDPAIDQYAHPAAILVLTPDGKVSRYFLGIEFSARDLRFGLVDASAGRVGSAIERAVITWCYHYDPKTGKYGLITMRLVQAGGILTIATMGVFWLLMFKAEGRRHKAEAAL
jgi:protein SCO1/2